MNYTDEERGIFGYKLPSGEKKFADPLRVRRELLLYSSSQIDDWWDKYCLPTRASQAEGRAATVQENMLSLSVEEQIVNLARRVFKLPSLEEDAGGVEDEFCLRLLDAFFDWQEKKRANPGMRPGSSVILVSPPAAGDSLTSSGSAFSSADSDCGCGKATT